MKREYDFEALALQYGFNVKEMEKVCRISDLLEDVSAVKSLSDRLSLYGGTALTFIDRSIKLHAHTPHHNPLVPDQLRPTF